VQPQFHAIQAIEQRRVHEQFSPIADINGAPVVGQQRRAAGD
jgi:hypothetical protein